MKSFVGGLILGAGVIFGALFYYGVLTKSDFAGGETSAPVAIETGNAQSPIAKDLDLMFQAAYQPDQPGASVIVARGDDIILNKGYGLADVEHSLAIETHMPFRLGSVTKQITAVAILMLEEDGLLNLSDSITVHLPDYPTHGETIKLEHLLHHTSGIPNYTDFPGFFETEMRKDKTIDELLAVFKDKPLDFKPGTMWKYSNSAYIVLGAVVETISGNTYAEFVSEIIFSPLEMENSHYGSNVNIIPDRARGYSMTENGVAHAPYLSMTLPHAAGSLLSSSEDMLKWHKGLLSGALAPQDALDRAWTAAVLSNGEATGYGYGWAVGHYKDLQVIYHGGGIPGFNSYVIQLPSKDIFVAILSNLPSAANVGVLSENAVMRVLGDSLPDYGKIEIAPEILAQYIGSYELAPGDVRVLTVEEGKLMSKRGGGGAVELMAIGGGDFSGRR